MGAAGGLINKRFARHEEDDTWIPEDDEVVQIGEPLGRIAARHVPLPGAEEHASDIADAITAVVGLIIYGLRNLADRAAQRKILRGTVLPQGDEEQ